MMFQLEILGEIVLAMLLGGVIGFEREAADKPAGLRTHMLVAASATMLTGLGSIIVSQLGVDQSVISSDPIRIIEAVITGITFLGAGTIIRHRGKDGQIEGLTTAASLLLAGALGVAVALAQYILALGATAIVFLVLRAAKWITDRVGLTACLQIRRLLPGSVFVFRLFWNCVNLGVFAFRFGQYFFNGLCLSFRNFDKQ